MPDTQPFSPDARFKRNMKGVHPDLVKLMTSALTYSPFYFTIIEGLRSRETQVIYVKAGKSQTMKSRHLTGHAVDILILIDGASNWDFKNYKRVAAHVKAWAKKLGIEVEWGGDWSSLVDGPHFQLSWAKYPK